MRRWRWLRRNLPSPVIPGLVPAIHVFAVHLSNRILRRIARAVRLEGGSSGLWRLLRDAASRLLLRMRAKRDVMA
jgi:hypothetical protein